MYTVIVKNSSGVWAAAGGHEHVAAIEQGDHAAKAANDRIAGLAAVANDLHAWHAAEDLGHVLVREFTDVVGAD